MALSSIEGKTGSEQTPHLSGEMSIVFDDLLTNLHKLYQNLRASDPHHEGYTYPEVSAEPIGNLAQEILDDAQLWEENFPQSDTLRGLLENLVKHIENGPNADSLREFRKNIASIFQKN